jgi:excisionase family DNA binding protein
MTDWITTDEAAQISGYHPVYLRDLIRAGKIKAQKFGPTWQISHKSLQTYLRKVAKLGEKRGRKSRT